MTRRKTHEEYVKEVSLINPNILILGSYINKNTKILHKCKIDGHEWYATPDNIIYNKSGCPVCSGHKIGNPPEYKNSIWASEYREYFSKYLTEDQMKSNMPYSIQKMDIECPDCGRCKMINASQLFTDGFGCICSDGQSYPNKFMYALLNQLNVHYEPEYSPEWAHGKRYDIFIKEKNCIIENHGMQHYVGWSRKKDNLDIQTENDKHKKQLALDNGVKHYIVLDCRKSNVEWIKCSIQNSDLLDLLEFNLSDINWEECDGFATSNQVKAVSDCWNEGYSIIDIQEKFKLGKSTIRLYLNKAKKLGWCKYDYKMSYERGMNRKKEQENQLQNYLAMRMAQYWNDGLQISEIAKVMNVAKETVRKYLNYAANNNWCDYSGERNATKPKKCIRLSDNFIFESIKKAAKEEGINESCISKRCKKHNGWMFYDEWLEINKD